MNSDTIDSKHALVIYVQISRSRVRQISSTWLDEP